MDMSWKSNAVCNIEELNMQELLLGWVICSKTF